MKRVLIRRLSRRSLVSLEKIEEYVKSIVGVKAELTHQFWYDSVCDDEAINQYIISGTLGYDWVAYEMPTDPLACFRMGYKWPNKLIEHKSIRFDRDDFIIKQSEKTQGGLMSDNKTNIMEIINELSALPSPYSFEATFERHHRRRIVNDMSVVTEYDLFAGTLIYSWIEQGACAKTFAGDLILSEGVKRKLSVIVELRGDENGVKASATRYSGKYWTQKLLSRKVETASDIEQMVFRLVNLETSEQVEEAKKKEG